MVKNNRVVYVQVLTPESNIYEIIELILAIPLLWRLSEKHLKKLGSLAYSPSFILGAAIVWSTTPYAELFIDVRL